jgi:hypothetical protein
MSNKSRKNSKIADCCIGNRNTGKTCNKKIVTKEREGWIMQSLQILKGERNNKQMREKENQRLLEEYYDTLLQLRHLRAAFQQLTDHDLITACVYEMNAMQQRYAYLLQRIKEEKLTCMRVLR